MMTKDELLKKLIELDACSAGRQWAKEQPDMEVILRDCPQDWRVWAIYRGLLELAERCDWSLLDCHGSCLLGCQPQFAEHWNWSLLDGNDWSYLLSCQPQFAEHCNWSLLDGNDWSYLLSCQPQLKKYRITKGESK